MTKKKADSHATSSPSSTYQSTVYLSRNGLVGRRRGLVGSEDPGAVGLGGRVDSALAEGAGEGAVNEGLGGVRGRVDRGGDGPVLDIGDLGVRGRGVGELEEPVLVEERNRNKGRKKGKVRMRVWEGDGEG
jgi:hypothetical protein